jgi:Lsr2
MAQSIVVKYVDDIDGSEAEGEVSFGLDGRQYTIDLSEANAAKLRDFLAPFVAAARRARGRSSTSARSTTSKPRQDLTEVRAVLRELGFEVKDRGRISAELMSAYESRTPAPKKSNVGGAPTGKVVEFKSA